MVIERVLDTIGERDSWCVEFGAWDGKFLANTWKLISERGYRAVLIEADPRRFEELRRNHADRSEVIPIRRFVGWEGDDALDAILAGTPVPRDFDLLSIDIDGNDFHVWKALRNYEPKVVVVEFNPTIPNAIEFVQPRDPAVSHGSSLRAFIRLADEKGYGLVAATAFNAVFVREQYRDRFQLEDASLDALRPDQPTYLFQGFDGTIFVRGLTRLPWHGIPFSERRLQLLPRVLRRHPDAYGRITWRLFRIYRAYRRRRP
jgi:hypothetical protein